MLAQTTKTLLKSAFFTCGEHQKYLTTDSYKKEQWSSGRHRDVLDLKEAACTPHLLKLGPQRPRTKKVPVKKMILIKHLGPRKGKTGWAYSTALQGNFYILLPCQPLLSFQSVLRGFPRPRLCILPGSRQFRVRVKLGSGRLGLTVL